MGADLTTLKSLVRRAMWWSQRTPVGSLVKAARKVGVREDLRQRKSAFEQQAIPSSVTVPAADLEARGWARADDLADPKLMAELVVTAAARRASSTTLLEHQASTHKAFWGRLLDAEAVDAAEFGGAEGTKLLPVNSIFVRFALQPNVVGLVARHLGTVPLLTDVLLTLSVPGPDELSYSQLWHRDYDDRQTVKVFVYLSDVDGPDDGPFTLIDGPGSAPVRPLRSTHRDDAWVFGRTHRDHVVSVTGPTGSTFVCETSRCLHMGSRVAPGHTRLMYTANFISPPSVYPGWATRFTPAADPFERLVLGQ